MTQVSKKEIINQVLENIKNNGRSVDADGSCRYYSEDGNMCAIGLFTKNPKKMEYDFYSKNCVDIENKYGVNFDKLLREQYKGHSLDFWEEVQYLHDENENWGENNNLTETGLEKYNKILNTFVFSTQLNKDNFL